MLGKKYAFTGCLIFLFNAGLSACGGSSGESSELFDPETDSSHSDSDTNSMAGTLSNSAITNVGTNNNYLNQSIPGIDTPADGIYYLGYLSLEEENSRTQSGLSVAGTFFTTNKEPFIGAIVLDECVKVSTPPITLSQSSQAATERARAGDQLIVDTPAGTYATINESDDLTGSFIDYFPGALPVPNGFTVSISGDVFPSISGVSIPDVQPLKISQPSRNDEITVSTVYRWQPDNNQDTDISLHLFGQTNISCRINDDGEFSLPVDFVASLEGSTQFTIGNIGRFSREFRVFGPSIVTTMHSSFIDLFDIQ